MAAVTDERAGKISHPSAMGLGRNIFCARNFREMSPMEQLRIPTKQNEDTSEIPSPVHEYEIEDDILSTSYSLARDYITYKLDGKITPCHTDYARTLRRVGDELIDRHQTIVNAVSKRLLYSDLQNDAKFEGHTLSERMFIMIADEMSGDSQENWGRVVSLFVLGAVLASNDVKENNGRDLEKIISTVGKYVGTKKRKWIESNGGWEGFAHFFDNGASDEKKVWRGLLFAGLGLASLAAASRH